MSDAEEPNAPTRDFELGLASAVHDEGVGLRGAIDDGEPRGPRNV